MYSYSFFAGVGGDNFVQVYGQKGMYLDTVKAYIDKGVPVLRRRSNSATGNYQLIVGYEENGRVLLYLDGDTPDPFRQDTEPEIQQDWVFIGAKKEEIPPAQIYQDAFARIASLLTSPDRAHCSFGPKAFLDWADDIEHGRFDGMTQEQFDQWKHYTISVCNFSTNFCGVSFDFLRRTAAAVPELACLEEEYTRMNEQCGQIIGRLESLGGNFNATLAALQDREKRHDIAAELRRFAPLYENFAALIQSKLPQLVKKPQEI